jgi:DNA-binding phage protein
MLKDFNETFDHELHDPEFAALYLKTALQDNGIDGFLLALRNVSRAQGNNAIAEITDFSTVYNLLSSLGLQLSIEPAQQDAHSSPAITSS